MSDQADTALAMKAVLGHAGTFAQAVLADPDVTSWVAETHVQRLIAAGEIVSAADLKVGVEMRTVPHGYTVVPEKTMTRCYAELDELRTLAAEHLAGNDRTSELAAVIANGLDLTRPFTEPVDDDTPAASDETPQAVDANVDDGRPEGMPRPGDTGECVFCGSSTPDPTKGEDPDQAMWSFIRLRVVACQACHRDKTEDLKR